MPDMKFSSYFYGDEAMQFTYFRIPCQLITHPRFKHLSTDSKLLYGMLLDRMSLSIKNEWYDDTGRVYIYYTVDEIGSNLNCGRDKAMKLLTALSPLPVMQEAFERSAKGYTSFMENRIVIKPGMSQVQTIKTLVHEIAHAKLHQPQDLLAVPTPAEKRRKEVEAESIAYVVCQHFGIDTTDYSLAYVASWSKGTELAELKASLNVIHSTAGEIIDAISPPLPKLERTQEQRPRQKGNRRTQKARR